jgi:LTXXQ motif family protein
MFKAARRCRHILPLLATILCASSIAEARHGRYYGYYRRGFERNAEDDRSRERDWRAPAAAPLRGRVTGFGPTVEQLIRGCGQEALELKNWPLESLAQTVGPDDGQRNALEQMHGTAAQASDTLAAACPRDVPPRPAERLGALSGVLDALVAALDSVRPGIETFYGSLNDEQKARLVAIYMSSNTMTTGQSSRPGRNDRAAPEVSGKQQDAICLQWAGALRDWPLRQIESGIPLSDVQRAGLYDLAAAIYRATGGLTAACPTEMSFTPLGQVDAKRKRVDALRQAIGAIRPVLDRFEDSLNDAQKARLAELMSSPRVSPRRSRGGDDDD